MRSPSLLFLALILIGFLTGSTAYFFNKSRVASNKASKLYSFNGEVQTSSSETTDNADSAIDSQTQPAEPKGRVSYPANVYTVKAGEGLYTVGQKMGMSWSLIQLANGITNADAVQLGNVLVVPKYYKNTDYYRINFIINEDIATEVNLKVRDQKESEYFDPIKVSKSSALTYWGISEKDDFSLFEEDKSAGQATVIAKKSDATNIIGLVQPKIKGDNGLWAISYIEHREDKND